MRPSTPCPGAAGLSVPASPPSPSAHWLWGKRYCQQVPHRPAPARQSGCHRRSSLAIALGKAFPAAFNRLSEFHAQGLVRAHEMVIAPPPFQMEQQVPRILHGRPRPADQRRHALSECQIDALDERRVQLPTQAQPLQGHLQGLARSRTMKVHSRANQAFRQAAHSATRSHSSIGESYRAMRARLGPKQAIVATAHKIARRVYHLLKTGEAYREESDAEYERKRQEREFKHLARRAQKLGFTLTAVPATTPESPLFSAG